MKMLAHASGVQGADLQQELAIRQHMAVDQSLVARSMEKAASQSSVTPISASSGGSSTGQHLNARA